jgi:hypothetical protein
MTNLRQLYDFSHWEWIVFLAIRGFVIMALVLNIAMVALNLYLESYKSAVVSAAVAISLALAFGHQQRLIAKHRRQELENARRILDECYRYGICPDCGKTSLENMICQRVECGSRFERDPVTKKWRRLDE